MVGGIATIVAGVGLIGLAAISPKKTATVQQSSPSASPSPEVAQPAQTAKETCGDSGSAADWYPVFIDGGNLGEIQAKFCKDAIAKTREKTGKPTVQLASFSDRSRAEEFARSVSGDVGESYRVATQEKSVEKTVDKPESAPTETEDSKPQTEEDQFVQTLASRAKSTSARDGVVVMGYNIYRQRGIFWYRRIRTADSVVSATTDVHILLKGVAIKDGYPWDYSTISDMAEAIVGGMYQWDRAHPGDLDGQPIASQAPTQQFAEVQVIDPLSNCRGNADKQSSVETVYKSKTSLKINTELVNEDWYFVPNDRCFIHRSQISFN